MDVGGELVCLLIENLATLFQGSYDGQVTKSFLAWSRPQGQEAYFQGAALLMSHNFRDTVGPLSKAVGSFCALKSCSIEQASISWGGACKPNQCKTRKLLWTLDMGIQIWTLIVSYSDQNIEKTQSLCNKFVTFCYLLDC